MPNRIAICVEYIYYFANGLRCFVLLKQYVTVVNVVNAAKLSGANVNMQCKRERSERCTSIPQSRVEQNSRTVTNTESMVNADFVANIVHLNASGASVVQVSKLFYSATVC